eukprot:GHVT01101517.1.p1 GENE.GHVT01101517.1~~GHVT01101517.1.p1  ORF type:complete len:587 (-),score=73.76 GHVT01101517.1:2411-4171(-)
MASSASIPRLTSGGGACYTGPSPNTAGPPEAISFLGSRSPEDAALPQCPSASVAVLLAAAARSAAAIPRLPCGVKVAKRPTSSPRAGSGGDLLSPALVACVPKCNSVSTSSPAAATAATAGLARPDRRAHRTQQPSSPCCEPVSPRCRRVKCRCRGRKTRAAHGALRRSPWRRASQHSAHAGGTCDSTAADFSRGVPLGSRLSHSGSKVNLSPESSSAAALCFSLTTAVTAGTPAVPTGATTTSACWSSSPASRIGDGRQSGAAPAVFFPHGGRRRCLPPNRRVTACRRPVESAHGGGRSGSSSSKAVPPSASCACASSVLSSVVDTWPPSLPRRSADSCCCPRAKSSFFTSPPPSTVSGCLPASAPSPACRGEACAGEGSGYRRSAAPDRALAVVPCDGACPHAPPAIPRCSGHSGTSRKGASPRQQPPGSTGRCVVCSKWTRGGRIFEIAFYGPGTREFRQRDVTPLVGGRLKCLAAFAVLLLIIRAIVGPACQALLRLAWFSGIIFGLLLLRRLQDVREESLLAIAEMGLQLRTTFFSGRVKDLFVDLDKINEIVINEVGVTQLTKSITATIGNQSTEQDQQQ